MRWKKNSFKKSYRKNTFTIFKKIKKIGVNIYKIEVCYHHPIQNCKCRKPKTGLINNILHKKKNIKQKWIVGDNKTDLIAGHNAGLNLVLVKTGLGLETSKKIKEQSIEK